MSALSLDHDLLIGVAVQVVRSAHFSEDSVIMVFKGVENAFLTTPELNALLQRCEVSEIVVALVKHTSLSPIVLLDLNPPVDGPDLDSELLVELIDSVATFA